MSVMGDGVACARHFLQQTRIGPRHRANGKEGCLHAFLSKRRQNTVRASASGTIIEGQDHLATAQADASRRSSAHMSLE